MNMVSYIKFNSEQLEKIGNAVVYLADRIPNLSKTKLLKLLYILDEISIKKSGIPILNLKYKVWKFGPVSEELFIDLSSEPKLEPIISASTFPTTSIRITWGWSHPDKNMFSNNKFAKFINAMRYTQDFIVSKVKFSEDEFSENDIELMDFVIEKYGNKTAKELISYTHRVNSPWYNVAKENAVLELLESEEINSTEYFIDMSMVVSHDERKLEMYSEYLESH